MHQPETRYVKSGDLSIAYQVVGEGPFDIVLVPDWSDVELAWTMANHHGEIPRRLASFARLIVFDKRGSGLSDRVTGTTTLETRMDGVPMSLLYAATYPERVKEGSDVSAR